ncbi:MAG: hypothetical protein IKN73_03150 [Alphaproteobacteria bacterium]|nr:hypothetical protein [Alphaproteobacteria bacterium]
MFKIINKILFIGILTLGLNVNAYCEEDFLEEDFAEEFVEETEPVEVMQADEISADAINNYEMSGSLFEKITNLEQEKVVMQLEKERAQLDLELERLNAEKIKLQMELDTLSGRAEQQQQELEVAKAQLEAQSEQIKRQREQLDEEPEEKPVEKVSKKQSGPIYDSYKLVNVIGVGNELQATIEEVSTGQNKRIAVGKNVDGYVVKSISLNEGIVFEKDGETVTLNIGK